LIDAAQDIAKGWRQSATQECAGGRFDTRLRRSKQKKRELQRAATTNSWAKTDMDFPRAGIARLIWLKRQSAGRGSLAYRGVPDVRCANSP
jgi:hypothetical protein